MTRNAADATTPDLRKQIDALAYKRGFQDGVDGQVPMDPSDKYIEGYRDGRRERVVRSRRGR